MVAALALAGGLGTAQVGQSNIPSQQTFQSQRDMKATRPTKSIRHKTIVEQSGGLDVIRDGGEFGLTPMQYGMRYGNGKSRNVKNNMLRYSHNAKVKRRKA